MPAQVGEAGSALMHSGVWFTPFAKEDNKYRMHYGLQPNTRRLWRIRLCGEKRHAPKIILMELY